MALATVLLLDIQTMASRHPLRAASSCATLLLPSSLPAHVNTPRLISHRWMCTFLLQMPHF